MRQTGTRDHLITTGLQLLHTRGFHASGVQDIIQAAGVPKGTFYTHFESKEQFGAEVLGRFWEQRAARTIAVLGDETRPPLARLKAWFDAKVTEREDRKVHPGCMIGNFAAELAVDSRLVRDRLASIFAAWTTLLAATIREAVAAGQITIALPPETVAAFLVDAFEGSVLRSKVDRDPTALRRLREVVFTTILVEKAAA
ncbi:TetR family transcriptional regulator C-terminal domain-containing protein [Rhodopila sp.]|jgi:TetR/AcrR family transcriptional repressor of nem operon|uniref:TetR family transcriptional regulator C-terminal domain-containing protein n=1 Tax=Rhodopila sp. TaxID=2480087 RepID=UPI002CD10AF4|nr:TetR family transcriptional regulator C-terminal domain-containing protein [Rhodopila sp.]HVZ08734.1 TetR family transcriptional regulator C-terminal domain-containing protein [Rhodopila sp.]